MKNKAILPVLTILFFVAFLPMAAHALRPPAKIVGVTSVPFDGGLSLLVAAGVGYAAKKGRDRKNAKKPNLEK